jgi:deoxyribonuclease V
MMACLDVHYFQDKAQAAAIVFQDWKSPLSISEYTATIINPAKYEPGRFFLRELHPLLTVIDHIIETIDCFVIDGYCYLSSNLNPGLGAYLKESLLNNETIVGVAKKRYRETKHAVELIRGKSTRPLFITSIGIECALAAQNVASMAGEYRIPSLLKAVDQLSRKHKERFR